MVGVSSTDTFLVRVDRELTELKFIFRHSGGTFWS